MFESITIADILRLVFDGGVMIGAIYGVYRYMKKDRKAVVKNAVEAAVKEMEKYAEIKDAVAEANIRIDKAESRIETFKSDAQSKIESLKKDTENDKQELQSRLADDKRELQSDIMEIKTSLSQIYELNRQHLENHHTSK